MYQYSLVYFTDLYSAAIEKSEKSNDLQTRLSHFRNYFRISLFRNIGRSLFQKDRLLFSAIIAIKLAKPPAKVLEYLTVNNHSVGKSGGL